MDSKADLLFELARLQAEQGDLLAAAKSFSTAQIEYLRSHDYVGYLKCSNCLLPIYAEIEDDLSIREVRQHLHEMIVSGEIESTAESLYTLALAARYDEQHKQALDFLERSFTEAMEVGNKRAIAQALVGKVDVYICQQNFVSALHESENLQVVLQLIDIPELKLRSQIQHGELLCALGRMKEGLDLLWTALDTLKEQKSFRQLIWIFMAMGNGFKKLGEKNHARRYLRLAQSLADPTNFKTQSRKIQHEMAELGPKDQPVFDIVVDSVKNAVIEKRKGRIDFKNQHILLDLLKVFASKPGEVQTKEALVRKVWQQSYDPNVHDNKLYVNIKRLRRLLEPDHSHPRYIFRGQKGYYLNRNTRVRIQS